MIAALELLAVISSGLLAGALLTEALVLVPYWKRMQPAEFLRLHHTLAPTLFRFYAPLTVTGTVLPMLTFSLLIKNDTASIGWDVSGVAAAALLGTYFFFFRGANATFAETEDVELASETLKAWDKVHNFRTAIALAGFAGAVIGGT